jgi:hypothetical protein
MIVADRKVRQVSKQKKTVDALMRLLLKVIFFFFDCIVFYVLLSSLIDLIPSIFLPS